MNVPDFLVVGTARAGTTSLHHHLKQHPGIFLPRQKEPCFYCFAGKKPVYKNGKFAFAVTDPIAYRKLYEDATIHQVTGDISTPYLYLHKETISNIYHYHSRPETIKIIIILRNPIERAYSQFLWKVRDGRESLSFDEAILQEQQRMKENYSFDYFYAHRGLYYQQVKNYLDNFHSVKVIMYDNFLEDFENTMKSICSFTGASDNFVFTKLEQVNRSGIPRFSALGKIVTMESRLKFRMLNYLPENVRLGVKEVFNKFNTSRKLPASISMQTRKYLVDFYREDITKLGQLLGKNLFHWLSV